VSIAQLDLGRSFVMGRGTTAACAAVAALALVLTSAAQADPPAVTATDIGTLGGTRGEAKAVNASGQVVGISTTAAGQQHAFSWTRAGGMTDLGTLGGAFSEALAINDHGEIVGDSTTADGSSHAVAWTAAGGLVDLDASAIGVTSSASWVNAGGQIAGLRSLPDGTTHAALWAPSGALTDLGQLDGNPFNSASKISDSGIVIGLSVDALSQSHAFVWTPAGGMVGLGALGGPTSTAYDVNDSGQVAGTAVGFDPEGSGSLVPLPFLWTQADGMASIAPSDSFGGDGLLINASGQVAGDIRRVGTHAFVWTALGGLIDLGAFGTDTTSIPTDETDAGQVVGISLKGANGLNAEAFSWTPATGLVDLGPGRPNAVNESGLIVGRNPSRGSAYHATVWQVVSAAPADADGDGVDDVIGTGSGGFLDTVAGQPDTVGQIVSIDSGLTVEVSDAADPEGVQVAVGAGSGRVTLSMCGGTFTARVYAGSTAVLTCGSLTERVITGQADIAVGGSVVSVPAGVSAKVTDHGDGSFGVANLGGGSITVTTNGVTTTVAANGTATIDTTPPLVAPVVTGTLGANGWYRSNVAVAWTVSDGQTPISAQSGCGSSTVTNDTSGVTFTCSATSGGGTTATTVTIKRDATPPAAAYAAHATIYTVDQTVTFACASSDAGSGLATACAGVSAPASSFPLGLVTRSSTASDLAGNTQTATTTFTIAVTGASLCTLTRQVVQGSAKYAAATKAQKAAVDVVTAVGCLAANAVKPGMTAKQKAPLIAAYKATLALLTPQGWLTSAQATLLGTLSNGL
jgi:probable HAF family extracellular repeat protein